MRQMQAFADARGETQCGAALNEGLEYRIGPRKQTGRNPPTPLLVGIERVAGAALKQHDNYHEGVLICRHMAR